MVPTAYIAALIVLLTALGWMAGALRIEHVAFTLAVGFVGFRYGSQSKNGSVEIGLTLSVDGGDVSHGCGDGCGGGGDGGGGGD